MSGWLLVAVAALPLVLAPACFLRSDRLAEAATLVSAVCCFGLVALLADIVGGGRTLHAVDGWLRLDALGAVFALATALLYALGGLFSIGYLRCGGRSSRGAFARRYLLYWNLFAWTMLMVPLLSDFASLWIAVELTTVVSVLLVALDRTDAALEAAWKYVLLASAGLGVALLGVIVLYAAGAAALGASYLPRFDRMLPVAATLPGSPVKLAFLLAVIGFGTKAGFAPLHTWLPDAHSEAPSPVSAALSGALLANALYAVLRFYQVVVAASGEGFARHALLTFGLISLCLAAVFVLRQENYKRLLAYSSIEHVGLVALGIGFGTPIAVAGALLHVLNHAAAKGLAFFGAGTILRRYDTKRIDRVHGAATVLPWSGPMFLAALLALSGLPLSGIFRSEFMIVAGGFQRADHVWAALLVLLVNVAFFGLVWHGVRMVLSPWDETVARGEPSVAMAAAMVLALAAVVGIGVYLPPGLAQLLHSAAALLARPGT